MKFRYLNQLVSTIQSFIRVSGLQMAPYMVGYIMHLVNNIDY